MQDIDPRLKLDIFAVLRKFVSYWCFTACEPLFLKTIQQIHVACLEALFYAVNKPIYLLLVVFAYLVDWLDGWFVFCFALFLFALAFAFCVFLFGR